MYTDGTEHRDDRACTDCGGECCLIYRDAGDPRFSPDSGGGRNPFVDFDEYVIGWLDRFVESGALVDASGASADYAGEYEPAPGMPTPRFDPIRAFLLHRAEREAYLATLPVGTEADRCQYCGPAGCVLPWERRPAACTEYFCDRLGHQERPSGGDA